MIDLLVFYVMSCLYDLKQKRLDSEYLQDSGIC